jgi:hypothetical protein
MKSFVTLLITLASLSAFASGDNIHLYHEEKPNVSLATRPGIPTLKSPAPLSKVAADGLTLEWGKVEEATAYALQISAEPNFFNLLVNEPLYKETTFTVKGLKLEPGKTYYWRVSALKEGNQPGSIKSLFNHSSFSIQ